MMHFMHQMHHYLWVIIYSQIVIHMYYKDVIDVVYCNLINRTMKYIPSPCCSRRPSFASNRFYCLPKACSHCLLHNGRFLPATDLHSRTFPSKNKTDNEKWSSKQHITLGQRIQYLFCAIVYNNNAVSAPVIRRSYRSKPLLSGCVPNLQFYRLSFVRNCSNFEVDADCANVAFRIGVVREAQE